MVLDKMHGTLPLSVDMLLPVAKKIVQRVSKN